MSLSYSCIFIGLLLIVSANAAPLLIRKLLRYHYTWPVDCGFDFYDGRPLFGSAKTWRGLLASILLTMGMASILGFPPSFGAGFASLSMIGDLLASFCKRRMGKAPSSRARGLDTVPESLIPVWILKDTLAISGADVVLIVVLFFLMEEFISPLLCRWHIRQRPY